jgi:hypothetical protein
MFQETILQLNNGATAVELSQKLKELVQAVRATGKGGALALTLKVMPASKGDVEVLMLETDVKVRAPQPDRRKNVFFSNEEGLLSRTDPNQMELMLRPTKEVLNG